MKYIITILNIILLCNFSPAQLPQVEFDSIVPSWYFFAKDSLFFPGANPNINAYNSVNIGGSLPQFQGESSYILFNSFSQDNNFQDGGILYKINTKTGEVFWTKIINTNHGEDFLAIGELLAGDESQLYLVCRQRTNIKPEDTQWRFGGFSKDVLIKIDSENGNTIKKTFNKHDSIGKYQFLTGPQNHFFINSYQQLKRSSFNGINGKFQIEDFNLSSGTFLFSQYLPTYLKMPLSNINKVPYQFSEMMRDDQLISMHYATSKNTDVYPDESYLQWFELKADTFIFIKRVDIQKYFKKLPPPILNYDLFFGTTSLQGELFLSKTWHDPSDSQFIKYWLLWLDNNGEEKMYIDNVKISGSQHYYSLLIPFFVNNDQTFLIASPSITGKEGADILSVDITGNIKVSGSITTGDKKRMTGLRVNMNNEGDIVILMIWDNLYATAMGLHISDFGIILSSEDDINKNTIPLMTLSPNPALDASLLHITDEQYHTGTAYIYSLTGQKVISQKITSGEILDTKALPTGQYIVQYAPDSRPGYFLTSKLVKN